MRHYTCDRCEEPIPLIEHEQVEIRGKRYDICKKKQCRDAFGAFQQEAQQYAESHAALWRRRLAEMEEKFFQKEHDGVPQA